MTRPCRRCQEPLPDNAPYQRKYCPPCARDAHREQCRELMRARRNGHPAPPPVERESAVDRRECVRLGEALLNYPPAARMLYQTLCEGKR